MHKEALYGTLDPTTREWNDGLFTHILTKIVDDVRGESAKRHWIIFDGDVDPEWVENLSRWEFISLIPDWPDSSYSGLDDNKLLTLPNGERLKLPSNVRIMFEVEQLKYATLATVSRCGMIWVSDDVISPDMVFRHYLQTLLSIPLDEDEEGAETRPSGPAAPTKSPLLPTQRAVAEIPQLFFSTDDIVLSALEFSATIEHIMYFTVTRTLNTLFSLINKTTEYHRVQSQSYRFPLSAEAVEQYVTKRILVSIIWAFSGDA
jgi:dynein cytoplasmic 1 heavy chain